MQLEVITPDKNIFSGEIILLQVPGSQGSFEVLHNHAPIISTLEEGTVKIVTNEEKMIFYEIDSGVIEVKDNKIILLIESILEQQDFS